jgi:hypothetical protein
VTTLSCPVLCVVEVTSHIQLHDLCVREEAGGCYWMHVWCFLRVGLQYLSLPCPFALPTVIAKHNHQVCHTRCGYITPYAYTAYIHAIYALFVFVAFAKCAMYSVICRVAEYGLDIIRHTHVHGIYMPYFLFVFADAWPLYRYILRYMAILSSSFFALWPNMLY